MFSCGVNLMKKINAESDESLWTRMQNLEKPEDDKGRATQIVFWKLGEELALVAEKEEDGYGIYELEGEDAEPSHVETIEDSRDDWQALEELVKKIYSRGGTIIVQEGSDLEQVDVVQKAKILRRELSYRFPDQKFSVNTERYSGGSSINVSWTDGVAEKQVKKVVDLYQYTYPDEDLQSDYHHHDNHAFTKRTISDEAKEQVADQILDKFADSVFQDDHWRDNRFRQEYNQKVQKTSFSENLETVEMEA